ncbi:MAG TPA: hypothetical protein VMI72_13900, partial [Roseiarcus sp.]|nr:hypothetical protein [Roseiarcus sp.]
MDSLIRIVVFQLVMSDRSKKTKKQFPKPLSSLYEAVGLAPTVFGIALGVPEKQKFDAAHSPARPFGPTALFASFKLPRPYLSGVIRVHGATAMRVRPSGRLRRFDLVVTVVTVTHPRPSR